MLYSTWLAFPPLLALIITFWLLINSDKRNLLKKNFHLSVFLVGIIGLNSLEFLTYTAIVSPSLLLMKLYYIFMILILASILTLTLKISNVKILLNYYKIISIGISIISITYIFVIYTTDLIIADFVLTSYSLTRVPGELYFLIKILFLSLSLPIISLLLLGSSWKKIDNNVKRSRVILFSFCPLLISLLVVLALMEVGIQVNATTVLPVGTTFLLLVMIYTERQQDLFKFLTRIPYTSENLTYKKITAEIETFLTSTRCGEQTSLKDLTASLEQHIVNMAVEITDGSQVKAAELLNTSTSSICRKKKS